MKYEILGTEELGKINRVGFAMQDLDTIRLRLHSNVSMLDAFNNAYVDPLEDCDGRHSSLTVLSASHARLEGKLDGTISEKRSGYRRGSIVSFEIIDSIAEDDRET